MQLSKEEYARKRIHNGSSMQNENSVTRVTARHHSASLVMPNSYPRDGIFSQYLTSIKDSDIEPQHNKTNLSAILASYDMSQVTRILAFRDLDQGRFKPFAQIQRVASVLEFLM